MSPLIIGAILLTMAVGAGVLWAHPKRLVNRIFAAISLVATLWMIFVLMALRAGQDFPTDPSANPLPWLRANAAIAAIFPWLIWLLKESIIITDDRVRSLLRRSGPWLVAACMMMALALSDAYIPGDSTPDNPKRGLGYLIYAFTNLALYGFLLFAAFRQMIVQTGVRRIEMQFLAINTASACFLALIFNAIGAYSDLRILARLSPLAVLLCYALTAWAITIHRVFDARQVFAGLGQRLGVILVLCLGVIILVRLFQPVVPAPFDLVLGLVICGPLALWLDRFSRDWLRLSLSQHTAELRRSSTDLARSQPNPDKLVSEFEQLLRHEYSATSASLLFDNGEHYGGTDLEVPKTRPGLAALLKAGWATPESLQRQRPAPGLVDLRSFLVEHHLGVAVTAPRNSPEPTMILVLGVKTNQKPFTYPEVQQLQEIAEFMDNILARSRLTLQARQSEQLAVIGLVGASLAHEIRNPLVSIKTFAHLLPTRFGDPEFRQRFNLLIPAEVDRIDNLTQQLLDLAHPRSHQFERISLHTIVRETFDLMQNNAQAAQVELASRLAAQPDTIRADSGAIRQVIINLVINAIQALEHQDTPRRVELRTRSLANGGVVLEVADNGPGIPAEQRARLFRPFASTKTKGIGLGLAICADILREHGATINVPETGQSGATFRIQFPCPPPSS